MRIHSRYFYFTFIGRSKLGTTHISSKIVCFEDGLIDVMKVSKEVQEEHSYPSVPLIYYSLELSRAEYALAMAKAKGDMWKEF